MTDFIKSISAIILAIVVAINAFGNFIGVGDIIQTEPETSSVAEETNGFRVGFICLHDENSTYDRNFIDAAKAACDKLGVEYDMEYNIPESKECYQTAVELAQKGCDIVFANSYGHEIYILQAAQEYPDVQFCQIGIMANSSNLSNYHNAYASVYEGRYLTGVAAGLKINEMIESGEITADQAKMGYVGAWSYSEVISGYTAFYLGAKSVCPSVTMEVKFTGSWYDEKAEKEVAKSLISNGCVVISQHSDSWGAPIACDAAGVFNIPYNISAVSEFPNTSIVSSKINWEPYFEYMIAAVMNGKNFATDWCGGIAEGSIEITEINSKIAAKGTAQKLEEVKSKLANGSIHVFDTDSFTVKGKKLESYMADVCFDDNYTPDTEVISEGYFHESKYRSYPYFDVKIDGIVLLNEKY